jgi:MoaA/NifB/PqqE/SkfB family radical SAM enzyme
MAYNFYKTILIMVLYTMNTHLRDPTPEERQKVVNHLQDKTGQDKEKIRDCSHIGVFDNYQTDCPGYSGRVLFVLNTANPAAYYSYTFTHDGELIETPQAEEVRP